MNEDLKNALRIVLGGIATILIFFWAIGSIFFGSSTSSPSSPSSVSSRYSAEEYLPSKVTYKEYFTGSNGEFITKETISSRSLGLYTVKGEMSYPVKSKYLQEFQEDASTEGYWRLAPEKDAYEFVVTKPIADLNQSPNAVVIGKIIPIDRNKVVTRNVPWRIKDGTVIEELLVTARVLDENAVVIADNKLVKNVLTVETKYRSMMQGEIGSFTTRSSYAKGYGLIAERTYGGYKTSVTMALVGSVGQRVLTKEPKI